MADRDRDHQSEKDDDKQAIGGQQSHRSEYGDQADQTGSNQDGEDGAAGGMGGQPIGGNDSNTGTGTTLTAAYTPPREGEFASDPLGPADEERGDGPD